MPDNRNRKRPIQVKFFVDEKELSLIKARRMVKSAHFISPILTRMPRSSHAPAMPPRESFLSMKRATSW